MDTAAFILALLTLVAVGSWYVENEMKASDGAHGLFAVRPAEKPRRTGSARFASDGQRYRVRALAGAAPAIANNDLAPAAAPKFRRKERAWDRAAKPGAGD